MKKIPVKFIALITLALIALLCALPTFAQTGTVYFSSYNDMVRVNYTRNGATYIYMIPKNTGWVSATSGTIVVNNAGAMVAQFVYTNNTFNVGGDVPPSLDSLIKLVNWHPYFHQTVAVTADSIILPGQVEATIAAGQTLTSAIAANQTLTAKISAGQSITSAISSGQSIGTTVLYTGTPTVLTFYVNTDTIDSVPAGCTRIHFTWNNSFTGTINGEDVTDGTSITLEAPQGMKLPAIPFQRTGGKFRYDAVKP